MYELHMDMLLTGETQHVLVHSLDLLNLPADPGMAWATVGNGHTVYLPIAELERAKNNHLPELTVVQAVRGWRS